MVWQHIFVLLTDMAIMPTIVKILIMTRTIKMQCRDKDGNLLAYHQNVEPHLIHEFTAKWELMYGSSIHVISVNYFYS